MVTLLVLCAVLSLRPLVGSIPRWTGIEFDFTEAWEKGCRDFAKEMNGK